MRSPLNGGALGSGAAFRSFQISKLREAGVVGVEEPEDCENKSTHRPTGKKLLSFSGKLSPSKPTAYLSQVRVCPEGGVHVHLLLLLVFRSLGVSSQQAIPAV